MLTDREKQLLLEFLKDLPDCDTFTLASLVAGGNIKPSLSGDAMKMILQHAESMQYVLSRKCIKKQYLYTYLNKKGVSITGKAVDKTYLVMKLLEFWETANNDSVSTTVTSSLETFDTWISELGYQFCRWFYDLLNDPQCKKLCVDHFFNNCYTTLTIHKGNSVETIQCCNSNESVIEINKVKMKYNLTFAPNLTPSGLKCKEHHGHVIIQITGTLHKGPSEVVGFFEQMFMLLKDPLANDNWKIRNMEVRLAANVETELCLNTDNAIDYFNTT